jgi:hypothetical protein
MFNQRNPLVNVAPMVSWRGASLQWYEFQLHAIGTVYLERPGVYIFCRLAANENWDSIYVGETDNFLRRLSNELATHHRWESIRTAGATHICTLHVPAHNSLRLRIETDLRHGLNPPCNRQ